MANDSEGAHSETEDAKAQTVAATIFRRGPDADLMKEAGLLPFRELWVTPDERENLQSIESLIATYLRQDSTKRPLSIAVFGAPGSGKSRTVKELLKGLRQKASADGLPALPAKEATINLTQTSSTAELASTLQDEVDLAKRFKVLPLVFFDEFDTDRAGAPWGWLSWFLAPMQDGEFLSGGRTVSIPKALFFFAGGTASSFNEFSSNESHAFRLAKGPDFVSRLRAPIDVAGVNDGKERLARRAAIFHFQLSEKLKLPKDEKGHAPPLPIDDELLSPLLNVGRYRHGARSIEAVTELLTPGDGNRLTIKSLGHSHLLGLQTDRGPLDPALIHGQIGLSGGGSPDGAIEDCWTKVAQRLLEEGAQLAYGGEPSQSLTELLKKIEANLPRRLGSKEPGIVNYLPRALEGAEETVPATTLGMVFKGVPDATTEAEAILSRVEEPLREALKLALKYFRMRYAMSRRCAARFAISGKTESRWFNPTNGFNGRFPGVAEELMLALAMNQPVYIAGGFGGGAHWAGTLLGLGESWTGRPLTFTKEPLPETIFSGNEDLFRPPLQQALPLTRKELIEFFEQRALGSSGFPENGLSREENRELFASKNPNQVAELVVMGLRRQFASLPPRRA